jgi:N-acetylneuraminic acid mutarotase
MDLPAILAIIGGIALLVGILGGGVEAKEIKIPSISRQARNLSTVSGIVLIGISIFTYLFKPLNLQEVQEANPLTPTAFSNTSIATQVISQTSTQTFPLTWDIVYKSPKLARQGMMASYDYQRQVVVMFGGVGKSETNKDILLSETWEYDGNSWYQVNTPTTPSPRKLFGMAYDVQRKVIVMFGGIQDQPLLNDTWEYDGKDWKLIQTTVSPPPLSEFGFVYDTCRNKIVLFGGREQNGQSRNTWEYDGSNWEEKILPVTPPERIFFQMAFDINRCQTVLFGGADNKWVGKNDTWEYDGNNWRQINSQESPNPRWGHAMIFNPVSEKVVLFGGYGPQYPNGNNSQDTWEYDGTKWTELQTENSPGNRQQHILAFDGNNNLIIMFGGDIDGETWKLLEK